MLHTTEAVPSNPSPSQTPSDLGGRSGVAALPDPAERPLLREPEARRALPGMSRSAFYDAVQRGDLPSVRVGRRLYIPNAALRARLQLPASNLVVPAQAVPGSLR